MAQIDRRETLKVSPQGHLTEILLSKGDAIGQAVAAAVSILSFMTVSTLLFYLLVQVFSTGRKSNKENARSIRRFLSSDMGLFFLSLMLCDLTPTLAAIANLAWIKKFGVTGSAVFNLFLAMQTFLLLVLRIQPPKWPRWVALSAGWLFPILMNALGPALNKSSSSFYGPTSAGCWLTFGSSNYKAWFWTVPCISLAVLLIMIVLYLGLFLSLSGILDRLTERSSSVPTGSSTSGNPQSTSNPIGAGERVGREVRKVARKMLHYPIFYSVMSLPIVVSSLIAANGKVLPHMYYIVADCLFSALGMVLFVFIATRSHLLQSHSSTSSATPSEHRGIAMTVQTQTFTSPPSPRWESQSSPPPSFHYKNGGPPSPYRIKKKDSLDYEDETISATDKGRNDREVWDGPASAMSFGVAVTSLSPPPSRTPSRTGEKQKRRSSRLEMVAKSQGEEDSRGLVILEDLESESSSWETNRHAEGGWESADNVAKSRVARDDAL